MVPRKIEIERKKRIFAAHDLDQLLLDRNLDYNDEAFTSPNNDLNLLPLDAFDNTDFECRSVEAWLELGNNPETNEVALPAKALFKEPDTGRMTMRPCIVTGTETLGGSPGDTTNMNTNMNTNSNVLWKVSFPESEAGAGPQEASLHRLYICFVAEDPVSFADRLADAHSRRQKANNEIIKQIYADCMPREEIKQLEAEQISRISAQAMKTRPFKNAVVDTKPILSEINMIFMRTMNSIIFNHKSAIAKGEGEGEMAKMLKDIIGDDDSNSKSNSGAADPTPPPPTIGIVKIPNYSFVDAKNAFCFNSFLTKSEIIKAVVNVRAECTKVVNLKMFSLITKSTRLEEVSRVQHITANHSTAQHNTTQH